MPILKAGKNNEISEVEFEIEFQLSLTTGQRFDMMDEKSRYVKETLLRNGHAKPFGITKRK